MAPAGIAACGGAHRSSVEAYRQSAWYGRMLGRDGWRKGIDEIGNLKFQICDFRFGI
jgi:hypothetical protein